MLYYPRRSEYTLIFVYRLKFRKPIGDKIVQFSPFPLGGRLGVGVSGEIDSHGIERPMND